MEDLKDLEKRRKKLVEILKPFGFVKESNEEKFMGVFGVVPINSNEPEIIIVESASTFLQNNRTIKQNFVILYSNGKQNPVLAVRAAGLGFMANKQTFEEYFVRKLGFKPEYMLPRFSSVGTDWSINIINGDKIIKFYDTKVKLIVLSKEEALKKILNVDLTVRSSRQMFSHIVSSNQRYIIVYSNMRNDPVVGINLSSDEKNNKEFFEKTFQEKFHFKPTYIGDPTNVNDRWGLYVLNGANIIKQIKIVESATNYLTRERLRQLPYEPVYSKSKCQVVVGISPYDFTTMDSSDAVKNIETNYKRYLTEGDFFIL